MEGTQARSHSTLRAVALFLAILLAAACGPAASSGEISAPPSALSDSGVSGVSEVDAGQVDAAPPPLPSLPGWTTPAVTAPGVRYETFPSPAAGSIVSYHVFVPPEYDAQPDRRFPVLYWLHGSGGGLAGIGSVSKKFATAMSAGRVRPFLVVFPNGMETSMWVDSRDGAVPMETVLVQDLVAHIDATFRTDASRAARAIEGFSMGGYGAARLGFKFPTLFASVSSLAGGPLQETLTAQDGPPQKAAERVAVLAKVFGGEQAYFRESSPRTLAVRNAETLRSGTRFRVVVGGADSTLPQNRDFHTFLEALPLPHGYVEVPGIDHDTIALIDAMGDAFWGFHRDAFGVPP